jgi:succinyl-CoA synthetase beta subunit
MVNGAGLAMATMDMIKLSGGEPANFWMLVVRQMRKQLKLALDHFERSCGESNIDKYIWRHCSLRSCGTRRDRCLQKMGNIKVPIIVRLQGTNAEEAKN